MLMGADPRPLTDLTPTPTSKILTGIQMSKQGSSRGTFHHQLLRMELIFGTRATSRKDTLMSN